MLHSRSARRRLLSSFMIFVLFACVSGATEIERTFVTNIIDRGAPADGRYDVRLRLYDARVGGTVADSWYQMDHVIRDGHLEVGLPPAFATRSDLWLEIAVGEAGSGHFEALPNRQSLAASAGTCTVGTLVINERLGIGTQTPAGPFHIVSDFQAPLGLPPAEYGLMLGSEDVGPPTGWIQSYGRTLVLNPYGNYVGIGSDQIPLSPLHVAGDLRVDGEVIASGYTQPGGGEAVRIVRGIVASNGSVTEGTGFSASRSSAGSYTITFDTTFPSPPTVVTTAFVGNRLATLAAVFDGSAAVDVWDQVATGRVDSAFHFIAIGPAQ